MRVFLKRGSFFCRPYKVALWHHDVESLMELRAAEDMDFEWISLLLLIFVREITSR